MAKPPILSKSPASMKARPPVPVKPAALRASVVKPAIMESSPAARGMQGKLTVNTGSLPKSISKGSPTPTTPEMMELFRTLKPKPPPITEPSPASRAKPKIATPSPASQAAKAKAQLAAIKKVASDKPTMRKLLQPKKKATVGQKMKKSFSSLKRKIRYGFK